MEYFPGNMWAQKWDSLIDIMWIDDPDHEDKDQGNAQGSGKPNGSEKSSSLPSSLSSSLVDEIFQGTGRNKTVIDMVKVAEDFYVSMGNLIHIILFQRTKSPAYDSYMIIKTF